MVPTPLTVRAPAKVNLHLGVGDVRPDGFHELVTVFQALSLHDDVTLTPSDALSLHVTGEGVRDVPTDPTNLAARAVVALAERYGRDPNMRIDIVKGIPVAGGMAGGSADAAAALLGAATLWGLEIGRDELDEVAATLGSDVPFSLHGHTALGTGRGERLIPALARGEFHWTLALAKEGLSTPAVYHELDRLREAGDPPRAGSPDALLSAVASGDPHRLAPLLANDLQAAALSLQPGLRRTLRAGMEAGALAGIVSGSGPTCAFLCANADDAVDVGTELAGAGVCRTVRVASGPVPGATVVP